jgi:hypothetical protein
LGIDSNATFAPVAQALASNGSTAAWRDEKPSIGADAHPARQMPKAMIAMPESFIGLTPELSRAAKRLRLE